MSEANRSSGDIELVEIRETINICDVQILSNIAYLTDCENLFIYSQVSYTFLSAQDLCPYLHVDML